MDEYEVAFEVKHPRLANAVFGMAFISFGVVLGVLLAMSWME